MNNNQLDFYRNQINPNQKSQINILMRRDIREVSFEVDNNFLNTQFNESIKVKDTTIMDELKKI